MESEASNGQLPAAPANANSSPSAPYWRIASVSLGLACLSVALVTCRFAPRISLWQTMEYAEDVPARPAEIDRAYVSLPQLDNPWVEVTNPVHGVIAWRLLFPLIWYITGLPHALYFAVPQIGCVLVSWLVTALTHRRLKKWFPSWVTATLFTALPWFFVSSSWLLHFDSWLVLALLATAFVPSRWALGLACTLAPWIDERFVLALPLTLVVRAIALGRYTPSTRRELVLDLVVAAVASIPYPTIRALAWLQGDPRSTRYVQSHWEVVRTVPWTRFARGFWSGYQASWLFLAAGMALTIRQAGYRWGLLFAGLLLGTAVGSLYIAHDMSRSLMMVSPAFLLGMWQWEEWRPAKWDRVLPTMLIVSLFFVPAEHVMWQVDWPMRNLWAELQDCRTTPDVVVAAQHLRDGRKKSDAGELADAVKCFDAAIDGDNTFRRAYVERARIQIQLANVAAAEADLDEALRLRAGDADALLLRGIVRGHRGETALAVDDLHGALHVAPADWPHRDEAARLLDQADHGKRLSLPTNQRGPSPR